MRTNIISINELGKKVAFVNGNRAINKKNLKQKGKIALYNIEMLN